MTCLSLDDHVLALNRVDRAEQALKDKIHEALLARCQPDPETGCCLYMGAWEAGGQGRIRVGHRGYSVHRVAAWLYLGCELWERCIVGHRCGTPACFCEDHIVILPDQASALRFYAQLQGLGRAHPKLSREKARLARQWADQGVSLADIAHQLGVRRPAIRAVLTGRTYRQEYQHV